MPPKPSVIRLPIKPKNPPSIRTNPTPVDLLTKHGLRAPNRSKPLISEIKNSPPPPPPPNDAFHRYARAGGTAFVSLCMFIWLRDQFMSIDTVRGSSMAPTLSPTTHETGQNDWVLIRRFNLWPIPQKSKSQRTKDEEDSWVIQRGDIITFWKPHRPEEISIKRVIALGGDTVYPRRGYALDPSVTSAKRFGGLDGLPVVGEDAYAIQRTQEEDEGIGKVVVPAGHVWVEGDNWRKSYDSNDFGPISRGLVDGKAVRIWRGWGEWLGVGDARKDGEGRGEGERTASRVVVGRGSEGEMLSEWAS